MHARTKSLLLAAALWAVAAGQAVASPPTITPPADDYTITIPETQTPCGSFTVDVHDGESYRQFFGRDGAPTVLMVTGGLKFSVTSDETGRSIELNIPGPGKFYPDGTIVGAGPWLLYAPSVFGYAVGRILVPGGDINQATVTGRFVDLCPVLNP
jgi:hypothetical protein